MFVGKQLSVAERKKKTEEKRAQIICFIAQNYMVCGHGSWNVLCAEYLTCRMSDMLAVLSAASVTCFRGFVNVDLEDSGETDLW